MEDKVVELDIGLIDGPDGRIRLEIDQSEIDELAASIQELGLLQPIQVRPKGDRFEVVFGERRLLAHKSLGLDKIKAFVVDMDDRAVAFARGTENLARNNLSPVEEAAVYKDLVDRFGVSTYQIAKSVGISEGLVKRRMRLLRFDPKVQQAVHKGEISVGVAEELQRLIRQGDREYLLSLAVEHGVTVAVMRQWVGDYNSRTEREAADIDRGGQEAPEYRKKTYYATCDICDSPVNVEDLQSLSVCRECAKKLADALGH